MKAVEFVGQVVPGGALHLRGRRGVTNAILSAFHFACDVREMAIARQLLATLEAKMDGDYLDAADKIRVLESLVAGHERLWTLRAASH